ncbi:hypothetical protein EW146_g3304 [Bondarzewia mesenterica]|uniref:Nucleotide-sugar transporter n=1 Tax=Bondarzewia mesenterica TaxID=1095465 RepID=A0A4S4LY79_9AGAM|nr:hypothetical protein EW146_g3304 [Bondarzewia mesenterica]
MEQRSALSKERDRVLGVAVSLTLCLKLLCTLNTLNNSSLSARHFPALVRFELFSVTCLRKGLRTATLVRLPNEDDVMNVDLENEEEEEDEEDQSQYISFSSSSQLQLLHMLTEFKMFIYLFLADVFATFTRDQILMDASELRDKVKAGERALAQGAQQWRSTSDSINAALAVVSPLLEEISPKRSDEVNEACRRIESQPVLRAKYHKRLMRKAKSDLERIVEEEQTISLFLPLFIMSVAHHADKVILWNAKLHTDKEDELVQDVVSTAPVNPPSPSIWGVPLKYISLVTLAVQNASLTLLMHYSRVSTPPSRAYSAASAVLATELLKGFISLVIAFTRLDNVPPQYTLVPGPKADGFAASLLNPRVFLTRCSSLGKEVFRPDCWKLSIPAILYVIQNNLQFVAASNLDAATFQVSYQMKILTTAAFSVFLLRKKLTPLKWLALFFLGLGVAIVQIQCGATKVSSSSGSLDVHVMDPIKGFLAVAAACFTSGLAGVYFEMVLKNTTGDLWVRNVQLSLFSLLPALVPIVLAPSPSPGTPAHSVPSITHLFANFTPWAWATVLTQVLGGLITALVIKYADNIMKGFATSLSIVLSFLTSAALFHFEITVSFIVGATVVLAATWLYSQPDGKRVLPFRARRCSNATIPLSLASSRSTSASSSGSSSPSATFASMSPAYPYPTRPTPPRLAPSLGRRTPSSSPYSSPTIPALVGHAFGHDHSQLEHEFEKCVLPARSISMPSIALPLSADVSEREDKTVA